MIHRIKSEGIELDIDQPIGWLIICECGEKFDHCSPEGARKAYDRHLPMVVLTSEEAESVFLVMARDPLPQSDPDRRAFDRAAALLFPHRDLNEGLREEPNEVPSHQRAPTVHAAVTSASAPSDD